MNMTKSNRVEKFYLNRMANHIYINEIIFIGLVALCFMGDIIGEFSDHASIIYWLLLVPIFFTSSLIIEKSQSLKLNKIKKNHFYFVLMLWISALFSISLTLLLWHSGAIVAASVGIIVHIILVHTLFITSIILGLRFYLIGLFLFIMAGLTIALEGAEGITLFLSIPILLIGLYFKKIFIHG